MRSIRARVVWTSVALTTLVLVAGCGDDEQSNNPPGVGTGGDGAGLEGGGGAAEGGGGSSASSGGAGGGSDTGGGTPAYATPCDDEGWCWSHPYPQSNALRAVWVGSPNAAFAVGDGGTVLHYDGSTWRRHPSATTGDLTGVWGSGPNDVYAVGTGPSLIHYDGSSWSSVNANLQEPPYAVWGSGPNDVFAVGDYGAIYHFDGSSWTKDPDVWMSVGALIAVYGFGANDVFAVAREGQVFHFDGSTWTLTVDDLPPSNEQLRDARGFADGSLYAGTDTRILELDGADWQTSDYTGTSHRGIWGSSGTDIFAVGRNAQHFDGTSWSEVSIDTPDGDGFFNPRPELHAVGGAATHVVAVGTFGTIQQYDGAGFVEQADRRTAHAMRGIWASAANDAFAVGDGGVILHFDGTSWQQQASGTTGGLTDVYGLGPNDVYAVGPGPSVLHYDGTAWAPEDLGTQFDSVSAVWAHDSSNVFAVGSSGIFHHDGAAWVKQHNPTGAGIVAVSGSSPNDVYAVGTLATKVGVLIRYNGTSWATVNVPSPGGEHYFRAVWAEGPNNFWIAGSKATSNPYQSTGILLHYNGTGWSTVTQGYPVFALHGAEGLVHAVGEDGTMQRHEGAGWLMHDRLASTDLHDVWAVGEHAFAVGARGTILHRKPSD